MALVSLQTIPANSIMSSHLRDSASREDMSLMSSIPSHQNKIPLTTTHIPICTGCGLYIRDPYILKVSPDMEWHASCLRCLACGRILDENCTCYIKNGRFPYCKTDYVNLFGIRCAGCNQPCSKTDLVMRARNLVFHKPCFKCHECSGALLPGEEFSLRSPDNVVLCKKHLSLDTRKLVSSSNLALDRPGPNNFTNLNQLNNGGPFIKMSQQQQVMTDDPLAFAFGIDDESYPFPYRRNINTDLGVVGAGMKDDATFNISYEPDVEDNKNIYSVTADLGRTNNTTVVHSYTTESFDEGAAEKFTDLATYEGNDNRSAANNGLVANNKLVAGNNANSIGDNDFLFTNPAGNSLVGKDRSQMLSVSEDDAYYYLDDDEDDEDEAAEVEAEEREEDSEDRVDRIDLETVSGDENVAFDHVDCKKKRRRPESEHRSNVHPNQSPSNYQQQMQQHSRLMQNSNQQHLLNHHHHFHHHHPHRGQHWITAGGGHGGHGGRMGSLSGLTGGSMSSHQHNDKVTRVRTVLNEKQLHTLRTCYNANPRPDALMKEQLVEMTSLSPRVIRVWFQNKRCKDKKRQILMKQISQAQEKGISNMHGIPLIAASPVRHEHHHMTHPLLNLGPPGHHHSIPLNYNNINNINNNINNSSDMGAYVEIQTIPLETLTIPALSSGKGGPCYSHDSNLVGHQFPNLQQQHTVI